MNFVIDPARRRVNAPGSGNLERYRFGYPKSYCVGIRCKVIYQLYIADPGRRGADEAVLYTLQRCAQRGGRIHVSNYLSCRSGPRFTGSNPLTTKIGLWVQIFYNSNQRLKNWSI